MQATKTVHVGLFPRIAVDHCGSGELVVFLHGIGGNRRNWKSSLPVFGEHFLAAAWDARGYGDSDDYAGALRFHDFSDDLARVLDHFGVDRAHLVGLSMGGRIALNFAQRHTDRLHSLTLCATFKGFGTFSDAAKAEFIRSRKEPLLNGQEPADIAEDVARSLLSPGASDAALQQLVDSMQRLHKESYIKSIEAMVHEDVDASLDHVRVPTHVVCGASDPLAPPAMSREIVRLIPHAELTLLPDTGHLLNIENPSGFNDVVLNFLLRRRASAALSA
ncbi:3-oxoadipate enol-lactonase [Variovorax boronicumulans]|uniref:alpha/beta fold hydrolase n=1 Tax=Variovorax boronicumulans TaxID=436515 RepID=UPI00277EA4E4|nr:alpha/beta hydrolase [Variovorax boronicumulans]MDP9920565.1 3-oxoadipate enol-lactonase [Variovorax boronicumulans]